MKMVGKPDAGNPHVRFDEGGAGHWPVPTLRLVLVQMPLLGVSAAILLTQKANESASECLRNHLLSKREVSSPECMVVPRSGRGMLPNTG